MAAIIFDFDGTLADTRRGILDTAQEVLRRMGREPADEQALAATIGLPLRENFTRGAGFSEPEADEAVAIYRSIFDEVAVPSITAFPGVEEVLSTLAARGIPMAVATSRGQRSLELLMHHLGLDRYIPPERCFGVETVARPKPAPDIIYVILGKLGVKPEETLVVGDTTFDIEMGKAAGCFTCGVSYGNQSAGQLAGASPDYLLDDLRKLL
ncbi:MAG: HAD family hydrolase [Bacteroidales bacterium]|nr:HAD family hydrolase [Bacteroidales bacterium]